MGGGGGRGKRRTGAGAAGRGLGSRAGRAGERGAAVESLVTGLRAGGRGGLAATKQLLSGVRGMGGGGAFVWTAELSSTIFRSDEAREGMRAFLEQRSPSWTD